MFNTQTQFTICAECTRIIPMSSMLNPYSLDLSQCRASKVTNFVTGEMRYQSCKAKNHSGACKDFVQVKREIPPTE